MFGRRTLSWVAFFLFLRDALTLDPLIASEGTLQALSIIGPDDRRPQKEVTFPWSALGVVSNPRGYCSATMVGPRHVLTASHCIVYNNDGSLPPMSYVPSPSGLHMPHGFYRVTHVLTYQKVEGKLTKPEAAFDVALLILDQPIGLKTGFFGTATFSPEWQSKAFWFLQGYTEPPLDLPAEGNAGNEGFLMRTDFDLTRGESGASAWGIFRGEKSPRVVGVVSSESRKSETNPEGLNNLAGGPALTGLVRYARERFTDSDANGLSRITEASDLWEVPPALILLTRHFDEKLKIEKEEETKALKDTNDVPHFPTDDQGRVKKGTRIRDFLPDAPHNFTQDLLEHAQASAPLPPELDDTDFEPKQYGQSCTIRTCTRTQIVSVGSMEDVLTQNHNRLTELAQASPTTPHHRHPTPHRDNVFFAPHPDTESPPHLPTPPPPSMPTQRISQTDDPLRQELQSALERIRTLEAEVTELKKSRRRTSATSGALTRRKRPRSEKAISAHDSLPATLPDSKPMLVKSPASPRPERCFELHFNFLSAMSRHLV
ncbi:putative peptidase S1 [Paratrimastix pyriformis]|uniref:Peptidase S1 n=1 Tax=Paratrimastix pyriformis TaxID=342808 RepID=A0ABQ8U7R4_9EUKA|nr:putative peptidase S1 [Paratrimastix pyriformis]